MPSTVHRWILEFKHGPTSVEDKPCNGRPKTAITSEIIAKVHNIMSEDLNLIKIP